MSSPLIEKIVNGHNGCKYRVIWMRDSKPLIWSDSNSLEEARENCELIATGLGIAKPRYQANATWVSQES